MKDQCVGCKFYDPVAERYGRPYCTYAFKLEVKDGICLTRREPKKAVKP